MKRHQKCNSLCFLSIGAVGFLGAAQAQSTLDDDLFSLSLRDLMNIEVTTVSKRPERLLQAPGIVSVITEQDVKGYGARNLKDLLLRLPNYYMFDSSTFSASGATMRAGATQHLNNHILYLLNGRPLRESQNGGLHTDLNLLFPIDAIRRIEVIRGPGSVLYGSNAFSGTINIITNKETSQLAGKVKSQFGSHGYNMNAASVYSEFSDQVNMSLHINNLDESGASISAIDEQGNAGTQVLYRDGVGIFLAAEVYGVTVNVIENELTTPTISGANRWSNTADFTLERRFIDVGYERKIFNNWSASVNYTYNKQIKQVDGPGTSSSEFISNGYLYEATINGSLGSQIDLLLGVVIETLKGDLGTRGGSYQSERQAFYGQLDYQVVDDTRVTAGLQWNEIGGNSGRASPRLALIHTVNDQWTTKGLYAEAFRSPYGSELFFDSAFLKGDTDLKSEIIQTSEVQAIYHQDNLSIATTLYRSTSQDSIGRAIVDGTNTFVNLPDEVTFTGIELESNWVLNQQWRINANASYQENEDETGQQDVMLASSKMFKLGVSYDNPNGYSLGAWVSHFGDVSKIEDIAGNSPAIVNPDADAYQLMSININMNLGRLTNMASLNTAHLSLYVNNLLDQEVWFPEMGRRLVNSYPQSHEQGIYGTLSYEF